MNFLVIAQDLRVSGTSEGIVSRSFIGKLKRVYPDAVIDLHYFMSYTHSYNKELLPLNSITEYLVNRKPSLGLKIINAIYRRVFIKSLYKTFVINQYRKPLSKIKYENYDLIFVRSSGLEYETIIALKNLPILSKSIINFHDPYPFFFDTSCPNPLTKKHLIDFYEMYGIVKNAFACLTPSKLLSKDLQLVYGNQKKFYTLPHQYDNSVFDLTDASQIRKKEKPMSISYHGGLHYGRDIDILIDAYVDLIKTNSYLLGQTELVLRLKSSDNKRLKEKYHSFNTVIILDGLDFSNSANEQIQEADILILLESTFEYSNILLGKAPFVASLEKPILALLPEACELRSIIKNENYIAKSNDTEDVKMKLEALIIKTLGSNDSLHTCEDYFGDDNFKEILSTILTDLK
ncbi:hypothetical protein ACFX5D_01740 [Flavobacterium sp. LB3P45]|uniref:Uncharacterized protein n=1 Tax=Flavobacterium fructosi TaxID=3230416 RepID=A0ABW6HIX4_9FLAO